MSQESEDSAPEGYESSSESDDSASNDVGGLVRAAARGDQGAWNQLVDRFNGLLWAISRSHGLGHADAADVVQMTWLRLLEHLDSINDPARIPGWLATTCRHECLAVLRHRRRVLLPGEAVQSRADPDEAPGADAPALQDAVFSAVWQAFSQLTERCQRILRLLVVQVEDGGPGYLEAAGRLQMPVGSLGPTRRRCLEQLRRLLEEGGINGPAAAS